MDDNLKVIKISSGFAHTLVLLNNGTVRCWGSNSHKQIDIPSYLKDETTIVSDVKTGANHSVVLTTENKIICWGDNSYGQGDVPNNIQGSVSAITAFGNNTMALLSNGKLVVWGDNSYGQNNVPNDISNVKNISMGSNFAIILKSDGSVKAWGLNNLGQCNIPSEISKITQISTGMSHTVAVNENGRVFGWGDNSMGQLNFGEKSNIKHAFTGPVTYLIENNDNIISIGDFKETNLTQIPKFLNKMVDYISCGANFTIFLSKQGKLFGIGDNTKEQLNIPHWLIYNPDDDILAKLPVETVIPNLLGGEYKEKYLKYKNKYLKLKNNLN